MRLETKAIVTYAVISDTEFEGVTYLSPLTFFIVYILYMFDKALGDYKNLPRLCTETGKSTLVRKIEVQVGACRVVDAAILWHDGGFPCPCTKSWLIVFSPTALNPHEKIKALKKLWANVFQLQWWFVNPGSDSPEISLVWTKSAGTDIRVRTNGRFSNPENLLIRKYGPEQTCPV